MTGKLTALATCFTLAGCGGSPPHPPAEPGEEASSHEIEVPDTPVFAVDDQAIEERGYVMEIRRTFQGDEEALLIQRAEAAVPPREDVLVLIGDAKKQERAGVNDEEPLWWFVTFDGVRIPYAITADALVFYHTTFEAFRGGDFSISHDIVMKKVTFIYEASVSREDRFEHEEEVFEDVHVVRMSLKWSQYCGGECAMGFYKERIVVFDAGGEILAVLLDGETPYVVS